MHPGENNITLTNQVVCQCFKPITENSTGNDTYASGQACSEHPGHLFMRFHQTGNKITRARIMKVIRKMVDIFSQAGDYAFVVG